MKYKILSEEEKKLLFDLVKKRFAIDKIKFEEEQYKVIKSEGKKYYVVKNLDKIKYFNLLFTPAFYLGFFDLSKGKYRLSIDFVQEIGKDAKKNVIKLSKEEAITYMKGFDLEKENLSCQPGIVLLYFEENGKHFIGNAILTRENKLVNLIPKERRIKKL